ncbi:hypothetical protein C8R44DRAFT_892102 [Mycena epipterygia]|nr:hypothetical protein C8R44DRAFT_892102 [Mycena epipterygia]
MHSSSFHLPPLNLRSPSSPLQHRYPTHLPDLLDLPPSDDEDSESGQAACTVYIQIKKSSATIETNCRLATPFKYAYADRGSKAMPCRNVPIVCGLCPSTLTARKESRAQPAQWRYNMEEHLVHGHPEYASPRNPDGQNRLPHAVWSSMELEQAEELAMGVPMVKIPVPFSRVAGPDEGVDETPQLGVRRIPVRTSAPGAHPARKKRKANSGALIIVASGSGARG